jgi:hypothetical protein
MTFRIYQDAACATSPLSTISKTGVPVTNGHFSVNLTVDPAIFNGQGLWIRLQVGSTLLACQAILPVPYALSLRPGARIVGAAVSTSFGGAVFNVDNTSSSSSYPAFFVRSATASAVYGRSTNGSGVYGVSSKNYGVQAYSSSGTAGRFESSSGYAVWGTTYGGDHWDHGGYFTANYGVGVWGQSTNNYGVRGKGDKMGGVRGDSTSSAGVMGVSNTGNGVRAWSNGQGAWQAALDAENWNIAHGMAAYMYNRSDYATAHFENGGNGQVLWLVNGGMDSYGTGGGDFIYARPQATNNAKFRVATNGGVYSDEVFHSGGADVAEMLPAESGLQPGDVLAIGADGQLTRSTTANQASVAGVYSTRPGFLGGHPVEGAVPGAVPLAVVGVVPVKVSAENGPIHPGDLLVASSTPGHAMKAGANPAVGTVIGKALGGLEAGTGVLSALIMLQ